MRKYLLGAIALLYSLVSFCQKDNQFIVSKIEKVTVFLQGAQVERTASQLLPAGKYNLVFSNISPLIDKQSIQLKAEGKLTVLSVTHQLNHLKEQTTQAEIRVIELQKEDLLEKIALQKDLKNVFKQEEQFMIKNQEIKGAATTLKTADLKEAADFQRQRLTEIYQKLQENERSLKKMELELNKLNTQLQALHQKKDLSTSEIIVSVDVRENTSGAFRLSYLVLQSSWFPTYDVRVQDINQPLTLQMKANLRQQSGEDWKNVKLLLSTGNPRDDGSKPVLLPWYLRYYTPAALSSSTLGLQGRIAGLSVSGNNTVRGSIRDERGVPLAGATVMVKGTSQGVSTDASGNFSLPYINGSSLIVSMVGYEPKELPVSSDLHIALKAAESELQEVVVVGYGSNGDAGYDPRDYAPGYRKKKEQTAINTTTIYQPTNTIFEIENPYSIPDDGKLYTVGISDFELDALYEYYAVPKLESSAFLTAKVPDWQGLNLLPGEANLFFEGTFLGSATLDLASAGDTLNLSLGRDPGVVVKRSLLKEYSSRKFLGSNKTENRQYEILVRNNKPYPIHIIIEDQFPVSTGKEIEVDKLSFEGGQLDDDTKKISWNLQVETKKETKLKMAYTVKYPKDKTLHLD